MEKQKIPAHYIKMYRFQEITRSSFNKDKKPIYYDGLRITSQLIFRH